LGVTKRVQGPANDGMNSSFHLFARIFAMSSLLSSPMTQLTFSWVEPEAVAVPATSAPATRIPLGIEAPVAKPSPVKTEPARNIATASKVFAGSVSTERRGKPEHISDLLLVVLVRYGISPDEFLAGIQ
jgi:hypothetical protein